MKSFCLLPILISLGAAWAQPPQPAAPAPPAPNGAPAPNAAPAPNPPPAPPAPRASRPPMERRLEAGPPRWWENQEMVQRLGLTTDQQKKMEDIFQQSRLRLIDLNAALQKEEAIMEPLMAADQPDETKLLAQIDKVAQARAELEKANGRMLVGMRRVLTPDQWKKLQAAEGPGGRGPMPRGQGGPGGPPPPNGGRGPGGPGDGQPQQEEQ
jgi:Spy/CpxP family protein refolding chaperone